MEQWMERLLLATFFLYLISSVAFWGASNEKKGDGKRSVKRRWEHFAVGAAGAGVFLHLSFIVLRILVSGHFPTTNMFEFTAFLCFAVALAFIVIWFMYRPVVLGAFVMPLVVILLAYAAAFPRDVQPLIPALQSYWLPVHVSLAALGEGAFGVGFVAGLLYLLRHVHKEEERGKHARWLEVTLVVVLMFAGFSIVNLAFNAAGYEAKFNHVIDGTQVETVYELPPVVAPQESRVVHMDSFPGVSKPWFEAPGFMKGENAARKFNSLLWGIFSGLLLYGLIRLISRKRLTDILGPLTKKLNPDMLDEVNYRATAIGFPLFTLGGLIFAMIWAHEAWGRFWNWDPKETWALITWLFYSAYLHLRLSRGWIGLRSAWLAVGGFLIIMINLIVINLVISGLHSYA
ncbi:c-type cytochrome biogenesis protein CcsB [Staphylospora marina]|uniref:c-type cytochrome biogenesis protein CcsB n=1 Tax=Staphylospora marina TaxID=2490858 RepID=UPI001F150BC1|nr:c-type cytochrome biogenesis protein CcsB [Staphylospora marina]